VKKKSGTRKKLSSVKAGSGDGIFGWLAKHVTLGCLRKPWSRRSQVLASQTENWTEAHCKAVANFIKRKRKEALQKKEWWALARWHMKYWSLCLKGNL
jgi:hypothetical protein